MRPALITILTDQPLAAHRRRPAQSPEGDGGSVLLYECGPVESSLTAACPAFDRDHGIAHLTQRRRQIERR
ncbi:hypothetical protein [Ciceribacter selenitireducens]|uniref:hypothetical protein n=1 Tax=Ciceribacter selenitireducens TaxID=448181 RepID=UPI0015F2639F|nr:hypothetical protein [Ciceribacter selenitireducens]